MNWQNALVVLLWFSGLAVALAAAEVLVGAIGRLGARIHLTAVLLGVLVAFGADAPEVTSALLALTRGSSDVGLGVVLGSNVYNLAGLLGISAVIAGRLVVGPHVFSLDAAVNVAATILVVVLVLVPAFHTPIGILLTLGFAAYVIHVSTKASRGGDPSTETERRSWVGLAALIGGAVLMIVLGSEILVRASLYLGPRFGVPSAVTGTLVLAIATSLPNTWAAVSLTRRGQSAAAIGATFSSNTINAVAGIGLPAIFLSFHVSPGIAHFNVAWLAGMTGVALLLLAVRHSLTPLDGLFLLFLYVAFAVLTASGLR